MNLANFPNLVREGYLITSPADTTYNCIAFAAADTTRWWWPGSLFAYWPSGISDHVSLDAFIQAYGTLGYAPCNSPDFEAGYEKIALYATGDGTPTHAARQVDTETWVSKLGGNEDIEHPTLTALDGPAYGAVARFLKRPVSQGGRTS